MNRTPIHARSKRLGRAVGASFVSKGATAGMAFVALPRVVENLSTTDFGYYALLATAITWANLINPAFGPTTGIEMAKYEGSGDFSSSLEVAKGTLALTAMLTIPIGFLSLAMMSVFADLERWEWLAVAAIFLFAGLGPIPDSLRLGSLRHDRSSLWAAGAVSIAIVTVIALDRVNSDSVALYALGVYGVIQAVKIVSFIDISPTTTIRRLLSAKISRTVAAKVAKGNAAHMLAQAAVFSGFPLSILLLTNAEEASLAGVMFILQTLALMVSGIVQAALPPLATEISGAVVSGDSAWVKTTIWKLCLVALGASLVGTAAALLFGGLLAQSLYGQSAPSGMNLAVMFALVGPASVSSVLYYCLFGLGKAKAAAVPLVPASIARVVALLFAVNSTNINLVLIAVLGLPELVRIPMYLNSLKSSLDEAFSASANEPASAGV